MKTLVLGGSGFVGTALLHRLAEETETVGTYRSRPPAAWPCEAVQLDLLDPAGVRSLIVTLAPDWVIHLVAEPTTDKGADAYRINVEGTRHVVSACAEAQTKLSYLSTDFVFDGLKGPYAESDEPQPINDYGRTKLEAENIVRSSPTPWMISRTSMVYGWPTPEQHPNFVSESIARLRGGAEVTAFSDLVRTPIYVHDLADSLAKLILTESEGLYHHGSSNVVTMHAFALQMCDVFACDRDLVRASAEGASQGNGRPALCGLTTDKVAHALGDRLPTTLEGLTRMKEAEVSDV